MSMPPRVTVIMPHYSDLAGLDSCLAALARQTYPAGDFEIVVADNNSPQGEAAVAAAIKDRARLVIVKEKGAGPARNGAVAAARGEIFAFTDSDCQPATTWLERGVAALAKNDVVGGRVDVFFQDRDRVSGVEAFDTVFGFDNKAFVLQKNFTVTANLFCTRAGFDLVGGFLEGVSEDVEWSRRATAAGLSLGYADDALVDHPARRTWEDLRTKWVRVDAETYQLHFMHGGSRASWLLRCAALPFSALVHAPKLLTFARLPFPARLRGVVALFRIRLWRSRNCLQLLRADVKAPS